MYCTGGLTSRSRIQGVRGSNPGKRSLRSFSKRINTFTLQITWCVHIKSHTMSVYKKTFKNPALVASLRWLRCVLLKPASMTDRSKGALQNLDVHWREEKKKKTTDFKTLSPPLRVLLQWNYFNNFWSEHSFTSGVPNLWPPGQNWPTWEFNTAELINVESQRLRKHCMLVLFCQIFHYIYI